MAESTYRYGIKSERNLKELLSDRKLFSGLKMVPGSGNQFFAKEDLMGDDVLVQVKSTRSKTYRLNQLDFRKLENNAIRFDKIPVFVVRFTKYNKDFFLLPDNRLKSFSSGLEDVIPECDYSQVASIEYTQDRKAYVIFSYVYRSYFLEDFK